MSGSAENYIDIINAPSGMPDGVVVSGGSVVGSTLIIPTSTGGTANINLTGIEGAIDFSALTPVQIDALKTVLRATEVFNAAGVSQGFLI